MHICPPLRCSAELCAGNSFGRERAHRPSPAPAAAAGRRAPRDAQNPAAPASRRPGKWRRPGALRCGSPCPAIGCVALDESLNLSEPQGLEVSRLPQRLNEMQERRLKRAEEPYAASRWPPPPQPQSWAEALGGGAPTGASSVPTLARCAARSRRYRNE